MSNTYGIQAADLYSAATSSTKAEVTDDPNIDIYSIHYANANAAISYLQVFDLDADDVTVGTTTPSYVLAVPAGQAETFYFGKPILHKNGFTIASATTATGSTNSPGYVTIVYKHRA